MAMESEFVNTVRDMTINKVQEDESITKRTYVTETSTVKGLCRYVKLMSA
jgi:hypothetical protein